MLKPLKYSLVDESEKEFYYYLGILSTKFAVLEYNILTILGLLIVDNFVLTGTILEKNSLAQNIELLKKINSYRQIEEKTITIILEKIANVRSKRNLFIHGIWSTPYHADNDVKINCSEPKILYVKEKTGRTWSQKTNHTFRLSYIRRLVLTIDEILLGQDYIIDKLRSLDV